MLTNETVISIAHELGFELVGFAKADILQDESKYLAEWLSRGYQAGMEYMERNFEKRENLKGILPDAKSVISLGINYNSEEEHIISEYAGKISRYAWGKDYHLIIWEKLNKIEKKLKEIDNSFKSKSYVDTGPVMDKAWAVKAGLGWLGKHTNIINKEYGSWFFIANIICNKEFDYHEPIADFCGTCTACIEACPTNAIVEEYVVDANKCISYLTIENKGEIPDVYLGNFEDWIFGCDICQDVCPWNNKFSKPTEEKGFLSIASSIDLNDVLSMTNSEFKTRFSESPIKRAKLNGLQRNAQFLLDSNK